MTSSPYILIVDDSESIRFLLEFVLKNAGYNVTLTASGSEALQAANSKAYDAVLADINMPEMDGFELIRQLRGMDSYTNTPIITITLNNTPERIHKMRDVGATGWIAKPFDPITMLSTLNKLLH